MKVNEDIFDKIVARVKSSLQSFHSRKRKARIYAVKYTKIFNDADREFILKEILHSQNKSIISAIANKKNIAIPSLGTFQYRETLEATRQIKNEVKQAHQITDMKHLDPAIFDAIIREIDEKKKEVLLPLYFKGVGGKGSTVNHNFKKL